MIRLAKFVTAKLMWLLLWSVILLALVLGLGRMLTPLLSEYQVEAEQWATEMLGSPVKIGALRASWHGHNPSLVLRDISIHAAEGKQASLHLGEIRVDLGLLDLLDGDDFVPREVIFKGLRLEVQKRLDGSVVILGLESDGPQTGGGNGALLFSLPRLSLLDSELYWRVEATGAEPLHLSDVDIQIINDGGRHQLKGGLNLGLAGGRMDMAADLSGRLDQPGGWKGEVFLKGKYLPLQDLLRGWLPDGYGVEQGVAELALWSRWEGGQLEHLQGEVGGKNLWLTAGQPSGAAGYRSLEWDELQGKFIWTRKPLGWQLDVDELVYAHSGGGRSTSGLSLALRRDGQGQLQLEAAMDYLQLADAKAVLGFVPLLDESMREALDKLQPEAEIRGLQVGYKASDQAPRWSVSADLLGITSQPWKGIPGMRNIALALQANQDRGQLDIDSTGARLDFDGFFRDPLVLDLLQGRAEWSALSEGGWRIQSHGMKAVNADIETSTRVRMDLPEDPALSPFLDLQTDFANGNVSNAYRYLPVAIMPEGVVEWLDRALVSGRVTSGGCLVRGRLADFPYEENQAGRFEVLFGVEELLLDYWPEWPRLERTVAEVRFLNNSFDAWVYEAELFDSELIRAHGRIRDLEGASPFELTGAGAGPLSDQLRLLRETPLAEDFASMVEEMRGEGEAQLSIDFAIPLRSSGPQFRIDGDLMFKGADLYLDDWQLALGQLQGKLGFDQDGIRAQGIKANSLGAALEIDVDTVTKPLPATKVKVAGPVPAEVLAEKFPGMGLDFIQGTANWNLGLLIPHQAEGAARRVEVEVATDLVGAQVNLPSPLGKGAEQPAPLYMATEFSDQPARPLRARFGDLLDMALTIDVADPEQLLLKGGEILIGGEKAALPEGQTLVIRGELDELDLAPWFEMAGAAGEGVNTKSQPLPDRLDIKIGRLGVGENVLEQFDLKLEHAADVWTGTLSSNRFSGDLIIPRDLDAQPISLRLDQLAFDFDPEAVGDDEEEALEVADLDPKAFPGLDLVSERLLLNGEDVGKLILESHRTAQGLSLNNLTLNGPQLDLNASGDWITDTDGPRTSLLLNLSTPDMGRLLDTLGFTQNVQGATATLHSQLSWPGDPLAISRQSVAGKFSMNLKEGRFLQVEPGVGRIFSLLNIGALQRRLTLDFSDLYSQGFGFEGIKGDFLLSEGNAHTSDLRLKSSAARIDISGRTGLVDKDFDQQVVVTPQVTATLPLIGTFTGGPGVGVALFLAQKLMGKEMDKITRYQYEVTGPWADPSVTQKKFFVPLRPDFGLEGADE